MNASLAPCMWGIISITIVVSYLGFKRRDVEENLIFDPERILAGKEYYRLVTSGFLHSGWEHLLLNMVSLYFFGEFLEMALGKSHFLLIYFGAILGGSLLSLFVHRHHEYRAYGASGGVCGIIFAYILLSPNSGIGLFPIPIHIPGWVYAIGFMLASFHGMKKDNDNVGHDAHLGGAMIGMLLAAALHPAAARTNWKIFAVVQILSLVLLIYLWKNPLFLSTSSYLPLRGRGWKPSGLQGLPQWKREAKEVDAILEKIAQNGMVSLTAQEKALLKSVSRKYQRRAESKKPESGLAI